MISNRLKHNAFSLVKGFYGNQSKKSFKWVDLHKIHKNSNGISGPTVFEVRMRKIHLAVDHTMAVVFWAPKQKIKQLFYKYPWKFDKFFVHQLN